MNYLFIFLAIVLYKAITNFIKFLKIKFYKSEYLKYLDGKTNHIEQYKLQTLKLLKDAGVNDTFIPLSQPMGYNQIANMQASVLTNFPTNRTVLAAPMVDMFESAIGMFRSRIIESFNPIYWIELIIFLPKNLLIYIGLDSEKTAFKLCNVILTSLWWLLSGLFIFFKTELLDVAIKFLGSFK